MKTDTGNQQPNVLETPEKKRFNEFFNQIKEEQKEKKHDLFKEVFGYDTPDKMLQTLQFKKS